MSKSASLLRNLPACSYFLPCLVAFALAASSFRAPLYAGESEATEGEQAKCEADCESTKCDSSIPAIPLTTATIVEVQVDGEVSAAAATSPAEVEVSEKDQDLGRPTHKQTRVIDINTGDLEEKSLTCFCLSPEGNLLAGCGDDESEIRVFSPDGKFIAAWSLSSKAEAINVGSDGMIYVAGVGRVIKLNSDGEEVFSKEAPHVAAVKSDPEAIRKEVIAQAKQMAEMFTSQLSTYETMIATIEEKDEADRSEEEVQQLDMLKQSQSQYEELAGQYSGEMSEEQIEAQVASTIEYKLRTASVSEYGGHIFLATGATEGYGYDVWKMDSELNNGEVVVSDLSGCCGQMDVQCCEDGIFVAENARHRVVRYDTDGAEVTSWGSQARSGLRGFGDCCNPMNVAFGDDGAVYTAEANSGRIKKYSAKGELLGLVGKVDLVPGCKKVAIGVGPKGSQVYMLDITRNHILVMEELAEGETVAYREVDGGEGGSWATSLKSLFGL